MRGRRAIAIVLALASGLAWGAAAWAESPDAGPAAPTVKDDRKSWTCGFYRLESAGLSVSDSYLAQSLPLGVMETLRPVSEATLKDDAGGYRASKYAAELFRQGKLLAALRAQRDALAFGTDDARKIDTARKAAESKIADARKALDDLSAQGPEVVENLPVKPIALKPDADAPLPVLGLKDLRIEAVSNSLDYLFHGRLESIQGYYYLTFAAYSPYREADVLVIEDAFAADDVDGATTRLAAEVYAFLAGNPPVPYKLEVSPDTARIFVNGSFAGTGSPTLLLDPGAKSSVTVSAPGFDDFEFEVGPFRADSDSSTGRTVVLEAVPVDSATVATDPPGATIYIDSRFAGTAPVDVMKLPSSVTGFATMEGYDPSRFIVGEKSPADLSVALHFPDPKTTVAATKDRFFAALGWFVVSLPVTFITIGTYQQQTSYASYMGSTGLSRDFINRGNLSYYMGAGSVALNVGTFINCIFRFLDYIKASER
jgi:hypothetical protein